MITLQPETRESAPSAGRSAREAPVSPGVAPERVTECNLCGGRSFIPLFEQVGRATRLRFGFVRCDGCGLKFVTPRLTEEQNRALYDESYFRGAGFDLAVNYVKLEGADGYRDGENDGIIGKIQVMKGDRRDLRILDAGCGTGSLLRALRDRGYQALWGLELSEFAARFARERQGEGEATAATIVTGDLLSAPLGGARFDVINATEVIEHLRDPAAFFARVSELLAPGGVFIYSTGNSSGAYARLLGSRWPYFHPEGHLVYFTPITIARYFERAGLDLFSPTPAQKEELLRCDDAITNSQLAYMGASEPGARGTIFRLAAGFTRYAGLRAATLFQGKCDLPLGVKR